MPALQSIRSKLQYVFWGTVICLAGIFSGITFLSHNKQNIRLLVLLYLAACIPFCLALWLGRRIKPAVWTIILTALIFRVIVLGSFPIFSDDVFRYLWEGKMQLVGINPYLVAPADEQTEPFREQYFDLINHRTIPAVYPPLSQLFFRVSMRIAYNLYFLKAMFIVLDMGTIWLLYLILKHRRLPIHHLLLYAWHPLVVIEFAGSGHQDIIGIFFLIGCLYFWQQRRLWKSALMLSAAVLTKFFPAMLFPLLLRKKSKWPYALFAVFTIVLYLPFYNPDAHLFSALSNYSKNWYANDSIFFLLRLLWQNTWTGRIVIAVIFAGIYGYAYWKISHVEIAGLVVVGSFLILAPTFHPWYVLWIMPFLVLSFYPAWLWLTMANILYYHILIAYFEQGIWHENLWIKAIIHIPFGILLLVSWGRTIRRNHENIVG